MDERTWIERGSTSHSGWKPLCEHAVWRIGQIIHRPNGNRGITALELKIQPKTPPGLKAMLK
ncbi:hypothetical protein ACFOHU_12570 [Ottowia pentelensis]|uniref:hypothetical protein n=1 Tax=Ottowia pentelensis TaxID=511108 RepID=UPI003616A25F